MYKIVTSSHLLRICLLFVLFTGALSVNLFAGNVLVYGPLLTYNENAIAASLGNTVTVVTSVQWQSMTTAQFAAYDAIIIPEHGFASNNTGNNDPAVLILNSTKSVWSPAITGKRAYISYDPLLDGGPVGLTRVTSAINEVATSGGTGLYFATGLLFFFSPPNPVVIDFLSQVDSIRVKGGTCLEATFTYFPPYFTVTDVCTDGSSLKIVSLPGFYMQQLNSNYYCSGNVFNVNVLIHNITFPSGNIFTVELSNALGDFTNPIILGTLASISTCSIQATIPNGITAGSGYKIRVTSSSSSPNDIASGISSNLLINTNQDWYLDLDGDHYYSGNAINQCNSPGIGYVASGVYRGDDYDDNNPAVHATPANILIYGPRLRATTPNEQSLEIAQGHTVTVVTSAQWSAMSTAQFASYDAIVIPDDGCSSSGGNVDYAILNATKAIWSPAISGRRCYIATDPIADNTTLVTVNAMNFVANGGGTGLCVSTSCSYGNASPNTKIDFLTLVDSIEIQGNSSFSGVNTVIKPTHPVMDGIVFSSLFGEHSYFNYFPTTLVSLFEVDNHPVIIARSETPIGIQNITSTYLCDGSSFNIAYYKTGTFISGNVFTTELSDASGSFANPINIGSTASITNGIISVTIPNGTISGSGYRIRIVSSSPLKIGEDNHTNLNININRDWYLDADNDHYFTGSVINQCNSPGAGYTTLEIVGGNDCNDNNALVNPSVVEIVGNSIDDNCNGLLDENNALGFDGNNDSIVVPYFPNLSLNPTYNYTTQTVQLTLSAWIKLDVGSLNQKILFRNQSYGLTINSSNQLVYHSGGYDAGNPAHFGSIPVGVWTHVAIVVQNINSTRTITFYINGVNVGTSNDVIQAYMTTSGGDLNIGPNFHGTIDEICIWNVARSQAEILSDMCGVTLPQTNLIAHYNFNQGIPNGNNIGVLNLIDNSGSNNNGTLRHFALNGSTSNWINSYILYEDLDNDSYGSSVVASCGVPNNTDCDDADATVHNGNTNWYVDFDNDHYAAGPPVIACHSPGATYTNTGILAGIDCDDNDIIVHDGNVQWYIDADGDHYYVDVPVASCHSLGASYTNTGILGSDDCDDADPQAQYAYQSWVLDADGDHFYVTEVFQCHSPGAGYVKRNGVYYSNDCNDNDPTINPGATEILANGIDENCNGQIDEVLPCHPTYFGNSTYYCIGRVQLGDINNTSSCNANHYGAYTNLTTTLPPGSSQTITIIPTSNTIKCSVYIDWNSNNILGDDPSELVVNNQVFVPSFFSGNQTANFTVPAAATFGNHIMRVISDYSGYTISDPCYSSYGEVEDYTINVGNCTPHITNQCQGNAFISYVTIGDMTNPTNCDGVSDYSSSKSTTAIAGSVLNYSISVNGYYGSDAGVSIYIDYNNDGDFTDGGEQVVNFAYAQTYFTDAVGSFTLPAVLAVGNYHVRVVSDNYFYGVTSPCFSNSGEIEDYNLQIVPVIYCQPVITYACAYEWITNVTLGAINNSSVCTSGYSNYSFSKSTTAAPGEQINYSVSMGGNGYISNYSPVDIYLDINSDGDFLDAGEQVATDVFMNLNGTNATGYFNVPSSLLPGNYRIRVRSGNDYSGTACDDSYYGETEDYNLNVTALTVCAPIIDNPCTTQWISNVTLGSINNTSGCNGGYSNYANSLSTVTYPGQSFNYSLGVHGTSSQQINMYIDYDHDGIFNSINENVFSTYISESYNPSGNIYIPYSVLPGSYRIRIVSDTYGNTADPCHTVNGEIEDYTLVVPYPLWYKDFDTDGFGNPAISINSATQPVGYVSDNRDCNDNNALIYPGAPEILGNLIDDNCNGFIDEIYCIPLIPQPCVSMFINKVIIGSINNPTGCGIGGYSDFTAANNTYQLAGSNVDYSIYGSYNDQKVSIYIDYNNDGDFTDVDEQVAANVFMQANGTPANGTFSIPVTQAVGNYRMRVVSDYIFNADPTACSTYYGEIEDYTLIINSVCSDATLPTISASSTTNCGAVATTLSITTGNLFNAIAWKWYTGSCGGTLVGSGPTISVSPTSTTTYYVRGEGACTTPGICESITINVNIPTTWYYDGDGDGYYGNYFQLACSSPGTGYTQTVIGGGDCVDYNAAIHPGAPEMCGNNIDDNCNGQVDENCATAITLNLTVFIQGYYLGSGLMQPVLSNVGVSTNLNECDTITVILYDQLNLSAPYRSDNVVLGTNGNVLIPYPPTVIGNDYYIVIRHRNSIETWSKDPIHFSGNLVTFDFTTY